MLSALQKIAQKPSDTKIRVTRIVFALILAVTVYFGLFTTDVNISIFDYKFADLPDELMYVLFLFPLVGFIRGIFDPGLFKKSVWKRVITSLGVTMMVLSVFFLSEKVMDTTLPVTTSEIAVDTIDTVSNVTVGVSWTDNLLFFFGFVTLFVGFFLTGKNLTTKNEKFGEVIKKIRV